MPWVGKTHRSQDVGKRAKQRARKIVVAKAVGAPCSRLRRRLAAMRAALRKLSKLEYVDPQDTRDILDADDRLRRKNVARPPR